MEGPLAHPAPGSDAYSIIKIAIIPVNTFIEDANGTENEETMDVDDGAKASIRQRLGPPPPPRNTRKEEQREGTKEGVSATMSGRTLGISFMELKLGVNDTMTTNDVPMTTDGKWVKTMGDVSAKGAAGVFTPIHTWIKDDGKDTYWQDVWPMLAANGRG